MGHFITSSDIPVNGEQLKNAKVGLAKTVSLISAVVIFVIGLVIWFTSSEETKGSLAYSYLFAFAFFLTLTLGGCFWTLLHNVSNSGWGTSVRRVMENLGFVFPFMGILAIPFLFPEYQKYVWEWMTIHRETQDVAHGADMFAGPLFGYWGNKGFKDALFHAHEAILASKLWYLNIPAWYVRQIFYFLALGFVIYRMRNLSVGQDTDDNPGVKRLFTARANASWGIPIMGVTLTFWAIDCLMTLDFKWFSTMWGVYFFAGCAMSSMSLIILTTLLLRKGGYLKNVVTNEHDHLMGKLTFAFVVFWAYVTFSQFMLYWYANITEETSYYLLRNTEQWNVVSICLVFGHFAVPFVVLLQQDLKKKAGVMIFVTLYLLTIHLVDIYHIVIPERGPSLGMIINHEPELFLNGKNPILLDILAFLGVGAAFIFFYLRNLTAVSLYPHRDPRILESANVHN